MTRLLSRFAVVHALAVAAALCAEPGRAVAVEAGLAADFDYSVPPRFLVPEIPDPQPPSPQATRYFVGPVRPPSWRVDLDACASTGAITSFSWLVNGTPLATTATCGGVGFEAPLEGTYEVTLTVADAAGATATITRDVRVQDWLLFGLGDSYGSGEGVPDEPVTQASVEAVGAARAALAAAEAELTARGAELHDAEDTLAELLPLLATAETRYEQWRAALAVRDDACDNFPPTISECAEAQETVATAAAELLSALAAIDLEALFGSSDVPAAIADLRASAEQAVDTARALLDAAQADAVAAGQVLDAALAEVGPRWQSRQCHRSQHSGQVQAARLLEEGDPHTSVTFVHLACSGALVHTGLLGAYEGQEPAHSPPRRAQIEQAAALSAGREIDAMIVSIGGNDVRFSAVIEACILQESCFDTPPVSDPEAAADIVETCSQLGPLAALCEPYLADTEALQESAETIFLGDGSDCGGRAGDDADVVGLDDLPCNYDALGEELVALAAGQELDGVIEDEGRVRLYLTAYPSFSRREAPAPGRPTELCGHERSASLDERRRNLPGITPAEMLWAEDFVAAMLAATMRDSAAAHGWRLVEDHVAAFDGHGYCADDNWIVRIGESIEAQGRIDPIESSYVGSVHPNAAGNRAYARAIADALLCDFYPDCDPSGPPRDSRETGFGTTTTSLPGSAVCGDATADGRVTASDALQVLLTAVGLGACAPGCCDVDLSGAVAASDALLVLRRAVGDPVVLECVACG